MAKIGRPKKPSTLEKERVALMLSNPPTHVHRLTDAQFKEIKHQLDELEKVRKEIIKGHSPTIPDELIYAMESIGDRSLFEADDWIVKCELKIVEKYTKLLEAESNGRQKGGDGTAKKASTRAEAVWANNQDLVFRIGLNHSIHSAANKLFDEWGTRGDGGERPHINTIKNWYKKISSI